MYSFLVPKSKIQVNRWCIKLIHHSRSHRKIKNEPSSSKSRSFSSIKQINTTHFYLFFSLKTSHFIFLTFSGSLAVASHLLSSGFRRGTHSPPWSKEITDCTESSRQDRDTIFTGHIKHFAETARQLYRLNNYIMSKLKKSKIK